MSLYQPHLFMGFRGQVLGHRRDGILLGSIFDWTTVETRVVFRAPCSACASHGETVVVSAEAVTDTHPSLEPVALARKLRE